MTSRLRAVTSLRLTNQTMHQISCRISSLCWLFHLSRFTAVHKQTQHNKHDTTYSRLRLTRIPWCYFEQLTKFCLYSIILLRIYQASFYHFVLFSIFFVVSRRSNGEGRWSRMSLHHLKETWRISSHRTVGDIQRFLLWTLQGPYIVFQSDSFGNLPSRTQREAALPAQVAQAERKWGYRHSWRQMHFSFDQ